jgi:hypothetical protein
VGKAKDEVAVTGDLGDEGIAAAPGGMVKGTALGNVGGQATLGDTGDRAGPGDAGVEATRRCGRGSHTR